MSWAICNNIPAFRLVGGGSSEHLSRRPGSRPRIERETSLVKRMLVRSWKRGANVIPPTSEEICRHSSMKTEERFCNTTILTKLHGVISHSHRVSNAII